jgi:3',5'-cyclic AMP phosphodiesterase CpdA
VLEKPDKLLIVHLTDLHVSSTAAKQRKTPFTHKIIVSGFKLHRVDLYNSRKYLNRAVRLLNEKIKPDLVLITGDIANKKSDTLAYRWAFEELQKLNCPYFTVLGDHDEEKDGARNEEQTWFKHERFSRMFQNYKIIGLPPYPGDKDIEWLRKELDNSKESEVIICHHRMLKASFLMKILSKMYVSTLLSPKTKELLHLIGRYDNIRLVLTGHSHTNYVKKKKNTTFVTTASLAEYPFEMRLIWLNRETVKTKVYSILPKKKDAQGDNGG